MNAIQRYRQRRIKRLEDRFGEYHGPQKRFDADEDEEARNNGGNNGGNKGGGGHGNTRIPYGLCQREGIEIGEDWTPKDAWDALAGKGYSAGSVYKELRKTGKVPEKKAEAPAKTPKELKAMSKTVSDLKKNMKNREKLEKDLKKASEDLTSTEKRKGYLEVSAMRYKDLADKILAEYGSEDKIPAKKEAGSHGYPPYASYQLYRDNEKSFSKDAEDAAKEVEQARQKKSEIEQQLSTHLSAEEYENKYKEAVDELLSNSPYTENVRDYRTLEEESADVRKEFIKASETAERAKSRIECYERLIQQAREQGDEETASFYENKGLQKNKALLETSQKRVDELSKQVSDYDSRMSSAKGDASDKDWKQIYDLSVERDTVSDGPYGKLESDADGFKFFGVEYRSIRKLMRAPTEEDTIASIAGKDKTRGSCVSASFAYIARKHGYGVLDFRGGKSQDLMAKKGCRMTKELGGIVRSGDNEIEVSKSVLNEYVEEGKEFWFAAGQHAAIVRKKEGQFQYLELQDSPGGWKSLDDEKLKRRFACKRGSTKGVYIVDTETLANSQEFISILGYVNTAEDKQKKGEGGGIK